MFTLIGSIVTFIFIIMDGIKILGTDWNNQQLNSDKTLWGILCFVILGPIASIVFGGKVVSAYENGTPVAPVVAETVATASEETPAEAK